MIRFTVPGEPMGQPRHRSRIAKASDDRQFIANYTPKKAVQRQRLVGLMAAAAMLGKSPMTGPVKATIRCYFALPKSAHRKTIAVPEAWHTGKPDGDNLAKLILDACNGIVYRDDALVAVTKIVKRRCAQSDKPRTEVEFEEIEP